MVVSNSVRHIHSVYLFIYLFIYLCANQRKHEMTDDKRSGKINAILSGHMFYRRFVMLKRRYRRREKGKIGVNR